MPFAGPVVRVTFARTICRLPLAFTRPGVTFSTTHALGFGLTACGFGFGFGFVVGFGVGVVGGVTGAVTSVDAQCVLLAPFVSLPFPVPVAQLTYVPVWVTRAEKPIVRSTPGPSVPSVQLSSAAVIVQLPLTGCCVTARNVTPPGAASARTTSCAWFGPLFRTRTV